MTRVQLEIFLGTLFVALTAVVFVIYGLNEEERMAKFTLEQQAQAIEVGAGLFESNCSGCHGLKGEGIPGLCPPLNDREFFSNRLKQVGWSGTLEDYIVATVASGRLTSSRPDRYAGQGAPAMPAWHEDYGGPLRTDQIRNIATFVMNWEATALGEVVLEGLPTPPPSPEEAADPVARGKQVFLDRGCGGCHTIDGLTAGTVGPTLTQIGTVAETRIPGTSTEDYLHASIVDPSAQVVEGFPDNVMPKNFNTLLSEEQLSDLIAFLLSLK
ncbi:MAG TPA: c-type cytochrome [Anaerolineales bacterium]|nr:c-type cytochrome [Anaerolineales bacterium]